MEEIDMIRPGLRFVRALLFAGDSPLRRRDRFLQGLGVCANCDNAKVSHDCVPGQAGLWCPDQGSTYKARGPKPCADCGDLKRNHYAGNHGRLWCLLNSRGVLYRPDDRELE